MPFQPGYYGKRSSFNLASIAALKFWVKGDAGLTDAGGGLCSGWADQSGQGHNLAQATGTNQPLIETNFLNGIPGVTFDGVDNYMQTANFTLTNYPHVFALLRMRSTNAAKYLVGMAAAGSGSNQFDMIARAGPILVIGEGGEESGVSFDTSTALLVNGVYSTTQDKIAKNNGSYANVTVGAYPLAGLTLGALPNAVLFANVTFIEFAIFDGEQTGTDLTNIIAYFGTRSGLW